MDGGPLAPTAYRAIVGKAWALAKLGASVTVHGNTNRAGVEAAARSIRDMGGTAFVVIGDLTKAEACQSVVEAAAAEMGGIDILINNAGSMINRESNATVDFDVYQTVFDVNVRSVLAVTKAAFPWMKTAGRGSVINTGSVVGRSGGYGGSTVYAAAKAAAHSITRNAAREFAVDGIRVNTVAPGFIATPFHAQTPATVKEQVAGQIPKQRVGSVEDCVGAYIFLSSDTMSGYITGQIIDVNGGQYMA